MFKITLVGWVTKNGNLHQSSGGDKKKWMFLRRIEERKIRRLDGLNTMGEGRGDAKDDPSTFCANSQVEAEPFIKMRNSRKDPGCRLRTGLQFLTFVIPKSRCRGQ